MEALKKSIIKKKLKQTKVSGVISEKDEERILNFSLYKFYDRFRCYFYDFESILMLRQIPRSL